MSPPPSLEPVHGRSNACFGASIGRGWGEGAVGLNKSDKQKIGGGGGPSLPEKV